MSIFCLVDDKYIPLYRIMWVSALPHFCGSKECEREGQYEIRLEEEEAVWANQQQRDDVLAAVEAWRGPDEPDDYEE